MRVLGYWLVIRVNVDNEMLITHTALWKIILLIPPSASLAVEFNKVMSVVEHVPVEIIAI